MRLRVLTPLLLVAGRASAAQTQTLRTASQPHAPAVVDSSDVSVSSSGSSSSSTAGSTYFSGAYGSRRPRATLEPPEQLEQRKQAERTRTLVIGLALMIAPFLLACCLHAVQVCVRFHRTRDHDTHALAQANARRNLLLDAEYTPTSAPHHQDHLHYSSPPRGRAKSKSVTWQSPFDVKPRKSHRGTLGRPMTPSELHFTMLLTPDKPTASSAVSSASNTPKASAAVEAARRSKRPRCTSHELQGFPVAKFLLDRLNSPPTPPLLRLLRSPSHIPEDKAVTDATRVMGGPSSHPREPSSLSLPASPPIPMLEDSDEYASDSPSRVSVSSKISAFSSSESTDDGDGAETERMQTALRLATEILACPSDEIAALDGEFTDADTDADAMGNVGANAIPLASRVMRASSSLTDFRHDLHHEDDQMRITRSSEYSF